MHIAVRGLVAGFPGRQLFSGADFDFPAGSSTALIGPSGAGKTTLLSMLAGYTAPQSGEIARTPTGGNVAWINQVNRLILGRNALDNVAIGALGTGQSITSAHDVALHLLRQLGLRERAQTKVKLLSGGEQQRIAIARALAGRPDLLLADEPTASLDAENREAVMSALLLGGNQGSTVIIATHDPVAAAKCDRVINLGP